MVYCCATLCGEGRDACYSDTEQTLGDLYALERESFEESIIDMDTWLGLRECRD